jgi:hypothetical protein
LDGGSTRRKALIYTGQQQQIINANIHALGGIRTRNLSVRAGEDMSCLLPRGSCKSYISTYARSVSRKKKIFPSYLNPSPHFFLSFVSLVPLPLFLLSPTYLPSLLFVLSHYCFLPSFLTFMPKAFPQTSLKTCSYGRATKISAVLCTFCTVCGAKNN